MNRLRSILCVVAHSCQTVQSPLLLSPHFVQTASFRKRTDSDWASRNPRLPWITSWSCRSRRKKPALSRLSEAGISYDIALRGTKRVIFLSEAQIRTPPGESVIWSFQEREELAMHSIGQKRKSSSRGSYEKSSGKRRMEKIILYRSWKSETIEDRWTFPVKRKSIYNRSAYSSSSRITRQSEFSERFQGVPWIWNGKQYLVNRRSQLSCQHSGS